MRSLKAGGQWLEAQALWVALVGGAVPLLYNGDFEQGFIADGFDWELRDEPAPRRPARWSSSPQLGERGRVLQVEFTGRPVAQPLVRQVLVLPAGSYVFAGDYMAGRCAPSRAWCGPSTAWPAGASWRARRRCWTRRASGTAHERGAGVPPDCSAVVLQLQTQLDSEALAGLRGQMSFDAFRLVTRGKAPALMIDLHSHILPGIDDGARPLDVSLDMARMAVADGMHTMACTPHIYPGLYLNDAQGIGRARQRCRRHSTCTGIALTLVDGADVHLVPGLLEGSARGHGAHAARFALCAAGAARTTCGRRASRSRCSNWWPPATRR